MGILSRTKGKVGEREVADLLKRNGYEARRGVQFQGGAGSPDVVHNMAGFHIEVKRTERLALWDALKQANADKGPKEHALIFHRANGKPWVIIMDAEAFLRDVAPLPEEEVILHDPERTE